MGLVTDEGEWSPVLFGHPELNVIESAGKDSGYDRQNVGGHLGKVDYLNSTLLAIGSQQLANLISKPTVALRRLRRLQKECVATVLAF